MAAVNFLGLAVVLVPARICSGILRRLRVDLGTVMSTCNRSVDAGDANGSSVTQLRADPVSRSDAEGAPVFAGRQANLTGRATWTSRMGFYKCRTHACASGDSCCVMVPSTRHRCYHRSSHRPGAAYEDVVG